MKEVSERLSKMEDSELKEFINSLNELSIRELHKKEKSFKVSEVESRYLKELIETKLYCNSGEVQFDEGFKLFKKILVGKLEQVIKF